jgi:RecB family exonuclease
MTWPSATWRSCQKGIGLSRERCFSARPRPPGSVSAPSPSKSRTVERLLEYELEGVFSFASDGDVRTVTLRSKADRIDLLADGTFRVVDYKLGRAPERKRSLQLPVYGTCAGQALRGRHGRTWQLARAGYIAFKEKNPFVELQNLPKAVAEGQERLLAVVDAVERGQFPVQPDEPFLCNWCPYPGVCRKDYVGDDLQ